MIAEVPPSEITCPIGFFLAHGRPLAPQLTVLALIDAVDDEDRLGRIQTGAHNLLHGPLRNSGCDSEYSDVG
jgi:hypothetical protein